MTGKDKMTIAPRSHRLADLTWPEIDDLRPYAPVAIVPLGATEQHGHGLAQRTDTTRAEVVADLVAQRLSPKVVVTPVIPVGVSEHHMAFPGTLTLSPITLQQVIVELVTSLHRHGWRKVYVITGHGGNNATVEIAVTRLRTDLPDLHLAWSGITPVVADLTAEFAESRIRGHSCEIETSQAMFADPDLVLPDRLTRGSATFDDLDQAGKLSRSRPGIHFPQTYDNLSKTGTLGDGTKASVAIGARLVETAVERISGFLQEFIDLPERQSAPVRTTVPQETP
ncbi:creatininase family protein [Amycolatopsis sp. FDAARGOS 1241]|uniref:creatininase family protein n=1 Tax=Amycolatopsis sp. FDAARGOS 1241 TaxID=2778070 RepID=UPI00194E471D|nr:creatininase family protein [Amycolatopsis sp. FDAARGOS 1241]QRP47679.1 creatininase family protein [Amycolatopsis sp. FDAARGOS 1241]